MELGIQHIFGVPGDFNLSYLEQIEQDVDLTFIGNCNELNAAFAADGYARSNGFAALVTVYGVGDLSAINGIAGAYSENIPVIHISGIPPLHAVNKGKLVHHTLVDGNYNNIMNCMKEFTIAQTRLTPANAAFEIDRVLRQCIIERRPVYIQLPSDITHIKIEVEKRPLNLDLPSGDPELFEIALNEVCTMFSKAIRPAFLIDYTAKVFGLSSILTEIATQWDIPYACLCTAKNIMDETLPQYVGTYSGNASNSNTREIIEESDCLITVGVRLSDAATGNFSHQLPKDNLIEMKQYDLNIGQHNFPGIELLQFFTAIKNKLKLCRVGEQFLKKPIARTEYIKGEERISQALLWSQMIPFFKPHDIIIAEVGTSHSALSGLSLPASADYIAQPIWASIGYTLPALLGSLLAKPERRHILFIGDGSIQQTVQELSTIIRQKLKPIIFVLNNGGYTIERLILGESSSYNDIQNWKYSELIKVFNAPEYCQSCIVETVGQLHAALEYATNANSLFLIELKLPVMDTPVNLQKFCNLTAQYDYGTFGYKRLTSAQNIKENLYNFPQPFNYSSLVAMAERQVNMNRPGSHFSEN